MLAVSFRNELEKLLARRRTWAGVATIIGVEVLLLGLLILPKVQERLAELMARAGIAFDLAFTAPTLATNLLYLAGSLRGLYLVLMAADLVAREVEEGTMRLVLARPVTRLQVLAGKVGASIALTFAFIGFAAFSLLLLASLYGGGVSSLLVYAPTLNVFAVHEGSDVLWLYARAVIVLAVSSLAVSGLGFFFSCLPLRAATATTLALLVIFADLILTGVPFFQPYAGWLMCTHLACWLLTFQPVVPWTQIAESLLYLGAMAASFWILGAMVFCGRDLR